MNHGSAHPVFDDNPDIYDALVDWPRRLGREESFYRWIFERFAVRRVLDAACGTGHHAAMFASWGLEVEGADNSAAMIEQCRRRWSESDALRWQVRSFEQPSDSPGMFDAALCVGNSLALAADKRLAERAIAALLAATRNGGVCLIHVLNLPRLVEGPTLWQKCRRMHIGGKDFLLLKGLHRAGSSGFIDFVRLDLEGDGVNAQYGTATLLGLTAEELSDWANLHGGQEIELFGNYARDPYNPASSEDLILLCRRK